MAKLRLILAGAMLAISVHHGWCAIDLVRASAWTRITNLENSVK